MAFFYSFTDSLKNKWLQFFQVNCDWIKLHMEVESVDTPDGGKRPASYLILGVVNALEPKLAQLMLPFSKLNADADTLIEVLGLHFDPDVALGNSPQTSSMVTESTDDFSTESVVDEVDSEGVPNHPVVEVNADFTTSEAVVEDEMSSMSVNGSGSFEISEEPQNGMTVSESAFGESQVDMGDTGFGDSQADMGDTGFGDSQADMGDTGFGDSQMDMGDTGFGDSQMDMGDSAFEESTSEVSEVSEVSDDAFGDISFDDLKDSQTDSVAAEIEEQIDDQMFGDIGGAADDAFGDVMKDVWSEENASQNGEANNQVGEEMSTDAIDTTEMAEIFSHN